MVADEITHPDIERRGRMYYIRKRVPARYLSVEPRREINTSLKTRDFDVARKRLKEEWDRLVRRWEAGLAGQDVPGSREAYDGALAVLRDTGLSWCPTDRLLAGPLNDLLVRIERVAKLPANSVAVAVALGGLDLPNTLVSAMAAEFERIRAKYVEAKNRKQRREWRNKHRRAAAAFIAAVGERSMRAITDQDAATYLKYWETKRDKDGISTSYANKHLTYMEQMLDAYFADLGVPTKGYVNPFKGLSLEKTPAEKWTDEGRKLALPVTWITDVLFDAVAMAGLNEEARDIACVCAELGTRENEIYDLPPDAIVLDHPTPHLLLDVVLDGEFRREIKNKASKRRVPLLGRALAIMCKYPQGFSRYRDTANYSNAINSYLKGRKLFPVCEEDPKRTYTIGGLRHTAEDRMIRAGFSNEERAYMLGHSIKAIRGRPIYGTDLELPLRALLFEKIAFAFDGWTPRSHREIDAEIDRVIEEDGHRRR